jgi:hypothetical protein
MADILRPMRTDALTALSLEELYESTIEFPSRHTLKSQNINNI